MDGLAYTCMVSSMVWVGDSRDILIFLFCQSFCSVQDKQSPYYGLHSPHSCFIYTPFLKTYRTYRGGPPRTESGINKIPNLEILESQIPKVFQKLINFRKSV